VVVAANVPQPELRVGSRLFAPGLFPLAAIATILIAAAYFAYRINAATPDTIGIASQSIGSGDHNAPIAMSAVPMPVEANAVERETTIAVEAPVLNTKPEAPKRASVRQRLVPAPATKRANAHQHPVLESQASVTPRVTRSAPAAPIGTPAGQTRQVPQRDPQQAMPLSLADCAGGLIARMVCDQRVRRRFCEGHWGEAPECASVVNDRGQ
jgi:hypothetical protein